MHVALHTYDQREPAELNRLVTNEPVEFEKQPVEVKVCMKTTKRFRGIHRIFCNLINENRRM